MIKRKMDWTKVRFPPTPKCPSLMRARLVIITSDEKTIFDDVRLHSNPTLRRVSTDTFSRSSKKFLLILFQLGAVSWCVALCSVSAFVFPYIVSFSLSLTLAIPEPCSIFPTAVATVSTCHGYTKASANDGHAEAHFID